MTKVSDDLLLQLLKDGNRSAYTYLYQKYYQPLVAKANYILKDLDQAEDQVQDLFMDMLCKNILSNVNSCLSAYLKTCVYHRCIQLINKNKKARKGFEHYHYEYETVTCENAVEQREQQRTIENIFRNLSCQRLNVCKLVYLENRKYKEAAQEMGVSVNSIKTHLRLANKALRYELLSSKNQVLGMLYA